MSVLTVLQDVSMAVGLAKPLAVFTNVDREWQEMQSVVNEAARAVAEAFDWQRLKKTATLAGNGVLEAFDLPTDFGRMPKVANLWSSRYRWDITHVTETDDWLSLDVQASPAFGGLWTLYGSQIHVRPIMAAAETVKFFYLSAQIVAGGKTSFSADADTFLLEERLLKLCTIYLWKQSKGQDFAAELSDFEIALGQEMRKDGGSMPIVSGNGVPRRSNVWPGQVLP